MVPDRARRVILGALTGSGPMGIGLQTPSRNRFDMPFHAVLFTQPNLFSDIDLPDEFWPNNADFEHVLKTHGYEQFFVDGFEEDSGGPSIDAYALSGEPPNEWLPRFFVNVDYDFTGSNELIVLKSRADALAFWLYSAPARAAMATLHLRDLRVTAGRAFRTWHGHEESDVCSKCESRIEKADRTRLKK
jgi:hypothetical protein